MLAKFHLSLKVLQVSEGAEVRVFYLTDAFEVGKLERGQTIQFLSSTTQNQEYLLLLHGEVKVELQVYKIIHLTLINPKDCTLRRIQEKCLGINHSVLLSGNT